MRIKYCIANHCGGLAECLQTEKEISKDAFERLIKSGLYKWYCYDKRIRADRYLIINLKDNYNLPAWLHYYNDNKTFIQ